MRARSMPSEGYAARHRGRAWRLALPAVMLAVVFCAFTVAPALAGGYAQHGLVAGPSEKAGAATGATGLLVSGPRRVSTTLFSDGFESGMGNWTVSGSPTWEDSDVQPLAGTHDCYCAGSTITAPGPYANNMNARMVAGPFDLSSETSVTLSYYAYVRTQQDHDYLKVGVSLDNSTWYMARSYSGAVNGWDYFDFTNVPGIGNVCGHSTVYMCFQFTSDSSTTGEGAYVDEVSLVAGPRPVYMSLSAGPATNGYNKPVTLSGSVTDTWMQPLPGRACDLYASFDGTNYFFLETIANPTGTWTTNKWLVDRKTWFLSQFNGDTQYMGRRTSSVSVLCHASLTAPVMPSAIKAGTRLWAWGTLKPLHTAAQNPAGNTKIYVYRYARRAWRVMWSGFSSSFRNTTSATKYGIRLRYNLAGRYRIRGIHADAGHMKTISAWRYFRVR